MNDAEHPADDVRIADEASMDVALRSLAEVAGITTAWHDYRGEMRTVAASTLHVLLRSLGLASATPDDIAASRLYLAAEHEGLIDGRLPPLVTTHVGAPVVLPSAAVLKGRPWRLRIEGEAPRTGRFDDNGPAIIEGVEVFGYHTLEVETADGETTTVTVAVAPLRCYGVEDAQSDAGVDRRERAWGLAAQIYSLPAEGDGGLGHYGALATLVRRAARHGASALAISPVHAMFSADLHRYSPYGPSSRLLANVLHIDPRLVFGDDAYAAAVAALDATESLTALAANGLVDWPTSSTLRLALLRTLFDRWDTIDDDEVTSSRAAFAAFRKRGGEVLESHATFEALHAKLAADDPATLGGWRNWPDAYRDPHGAAVTAFADAHRDDIAFHAFLQWQAARQLAAAQEAARDAGMAIGIVADLAVGADGGGSQAWSRQTDMLIGLSIGAPPDLLNALGQSWGLAAFSPRAMRASGFRPWIDMLRAAFAHAGGIRIDHVLGLTRMWLVPDGEHAVDGAYLRYPFDDLLRLVALESWRHRAIVIGEDLGTVPEGLPERLSGAGLLGIRVLWFERQYQVPGHPFRAARDWTSGAMAVTTTHDLPTTAGWWSGRDIDWRARLDLFGQHSSEADERAARDDDRHRLWQCLVDGGMAHGERPDPSHPPIAEALRFVGATPAPLALAPLEDVLGFAEQPNLPGTVAIHPNWRMRLPDDVDRLLESDAVSTRLAAFAAGRRRH